ncbi:hypothetical protein Hypma_009663 [Hypsizygus marmoreus]|uniref:Uncharacterized protein n=1 Tax=Hypsizygus marmoreus TaxID=39966 RepID=A0A369JV76_HYPMA|nr:hypothetical protein Hypma_009663 [Hypsizygus marmoreus]
MSSNAVCEELSRLHYELPLVACNLLRDARAMRSSSPEEYLLHRFMGRNLRLEYLARLFLTNYDLSGTSGSLSSIRELLIAQDTTKALMDAARRGVFQIEDWHVMISLLCDTKNEDGSLVYDADIVFRDIYEPLLPLARGE